MSTTASPSRPLLSLRALPSFVGGGLGFWDMGTGLYWEFQLSGIGSVPCSQGDCLSERTFYCTGLLLDALDLFIGAFDGIQPHEEETNSKNPPGCDPLLVLMKFWGLGPANGVSLIYTEKEKGKILKSTHLLRCTISFEQENLAQGLHQSQAKGINWPVPNINPWVGNQKQIGAPRVPTRRITKYGNQLNLRPEFTKSQSRNQQLSLNGYMHGHQRFQARQNQADFSGDDTVSDRHNSTSRGLANLQSQIGHALEHSPSLTGNSERMETAEAPTNFDFLGGQQQLMRGQQPGMPQHGPRQQSGFNDMQLLQQHIMFKQLQELQRQQQLDEARQQNSINQLSAAIAKQATGDQLPALINGARIHDASNYLLPTELIGGDSKVPSTSQMFMVGNMNWVQRGASPAVQGFPNGLMFSPEQGQAVRSVNLVPQQLDQSLYGAPIAGTRGNLSQYSHLVEISHGSTDMFTKAGGNQVEKPIMQSPAFINSFQGDQCAVLPDQVCMQDGPFVSKQGSQGRNLLGNVPVQDYNNGVMLENFHHVNTKPRSAPQQEFHGRQERAGWSGNLPEKTANQVGPSQGLVTLDPTEEKILFNTDDNIWDAPFGRSTNMVTGGYGNPLEVTDYLNVLPSIQSGSWSALMQSAVAETSSSDTGLQEEWSGLSFQKTELSAGNQPVTFNESGKQQTSWADNNLQSASSLNIRSFPPFEDANMSPSGFRQSGIKFSYERSERMQPGSSHESIQQSPNEAMKWLDRSSQQNSIVKGSQQGRPPMYLNSDSNDAWAGQIYEQSGSAAQSGEAESNAQNMLGPWTHQQSISSSNIGNQTCNKPSGWNMNVPLSPSGDTALKIHENENTIEHSQSSDQKRAMHKERDHDGGMWKADGNRVAISFLDSTGELEHVKFGMDSPQIIREDSNMNSFAAIPNPGTANANQETNQQVPNSHQLDYRKYVLDSSVKYKGNESMDKHQHQLSKGPRGLKSSMNTSDKGAGETYEKEQENIHRQENSNNSYNSHPSHHTITGGGVRENVWLNASDSRPSSGGKQKSSGPVVRKASGSRRFQYHPMGNLEVNVEPSEITKHVTHSLAPSHQVTRGLKSHEQGYFAQSKFGGHVSNRGMDMEKVHLPDFQGNKKGSEEVPSRGILPAYESNISSSFDQSIGFYAPKRTAQTSQNMLELLHKVDQSRERSTVTRCGSSDCNPQSEIAKPETSESSVAHIQHSESSSSQGFGLRLAPPSQWVPTSNRALPSQNSSQTVNFLPSHEISQRACLDSKSSILGLTGNETSHLNMQGNSSAAGTSGLPYPRNQHLNQYMSSASGVVTTDQFVTDSFDRLASHFRQKNDSHDGAVADHSAQASLLGTASGIPPCNLAPSVDTSLPISTNPSYLRVSGQQLPALEGVPVSQSSAMSCMSQQGSFSTMLHNAWTNVSTQQRQSGAQPPKVPPNLFQSMNPSNNNLETTLWAPKKTDDQDIRKGGNGPSEFGACSIKSQAFGYGEAQPGKESSWQKISSEKVDLARQTAGASQGQESGAKHLADANFIASGSYVTYQQDLDSQKHEKDPALVSQTEHASFQNPTASNKEIEAFGRSLTPSHGLHQNYYLLHQVQAMKSGETDPSKRVLKRFKGDDCDSDAHQVATEAGQHLYGCNTVVRDAVDIELNAAARCTLFPSGDTKMLSFSSETREDQNINASSQLVLGDVPSQNMVTFGQSGSQNHSSSTSIDSGRAEHSQISPQAPSWFEQYGTLKNGQMLPMYDAQRTAKTAAQPFVFGNPSGNLHTHTSAQQVNDADSSQVGSVWQSTTTTWATSELSSPPCFLPRDVTDQIVRPNKRKSATSLLLPWHKEVTQGSQRLQNISMTELDWAQAANRLIEKVDDEDKMIEDGQLMLRQKRRLILITQLMQQLLRPAPAAILSVDATSGYESVTYFVAKLALGDACSLISSSGSDLLGPLDNGNTLDKRASILDIRLECQDLEKFSIINRFAKLHGRRQANMAETSSSSDVAAISQKACPQKYVNALPMPRNLPEGVQCLSL
ncbi:hypothetical protein HHK36_030154 [Tetracentron sinense]|uniref:Uncharacterized protein n=1 Tax=Tetracentron sinense TaxID=13715 RepID=A0A835D0E1_TETSI|nr:hypothetical protein HHK36_030154 [Tetracentron sinense]